LAKFRHLNLKSRDNQRVKKDYLNYCEKSMDMAKPHFFSIYQNSLIFIEQKFTDAQVVFLNKFLHASKKEDEIIKTLIIIDCNLSDE
jgi:hypothetical protein